MRGVTMATSLDILMIGHFAKDRIVVDGKGETVPGGAVYYGSVALRHLGVRVGVVTRLHPDDFSLLDALREVGVEVFAHPAPETSGIENIYDSRDMERRRTIPLGFAGPFTPEEIPNVVAQIYAIVPIMAEEVDMTLLKILASRGPIALDVQGFVRVREDDALVFRPWEEMEEGLMHVTYMKVDKVESEHLTGKTDTLEAIKTLASLGPQEVVLTQSAGVTVYADGHVYFSPFRPRSLAGRTGRGDTCFATYLGKRLSVSPAEATRWAAAVTTLKQEKPGPWDGNMNALHEVLAETPVEQLT